ncbi:MAG: Gfo/Idh/MocA family oxidoreductase [Chloroflexota bacterium]
MRWGLLSTARINRRLMPAIRQSARGELAAVASRSQAAADAYAQEWDIPLAFGSYEAMLASDAVDAVYIALPNHLHAEWTINSLAAGKHVLCEKPFALSLAEVDAVAEAGQRYGRVVMEAFMYRFHPQMKTLGAWVRSGLLGSIAYVVGRFGFPLLDESNVRWRPEWGGGCLWDVGAYPVSLAQYIYDGPPLRVTAVQRLGQTGIDISFAGQLEYAGGGVAHVESSFQTPFHQEARIVGTVGYVEIERPFNPLEPVPLSMVFRGKDGRSEVIPIADEYLYLGEVENMQAAILDGAPPYLTLAETRNHVRTILALYKAAAEGRVVELAEIT